jgi:hypothetical protein
MQKNSQTIETVVKELTLVKPIPKIIDHLHDLFMSFVLYHEELSKDYKEDVITSYDALRTTLLNIDHLQNNKK